MKKTIFIITSLIAILAITIFTYLKQSKLKDFEPKIKEKISSLVHEGSHGLYGININHISIDIVKARVILNGIKLSYDSTRLKLLADSGNTPKALFKIELENLALDGIKPEDLISRKNIRLNVLFIEEPKIDIYTNTTQDEKVESNKKGIFDLIQKEIGSISLERLEIQKAHIRIMNSKGAMRSSFSNINVSLNDLLFDKNTQFDTTRFLFAKQAQIEVKQLKQKTADSLYFIKSDSISIDAIKRQAKVLNFKYEPRLSKQDFRKVVKKRKDRYDIQIKEILLDNINWWKFISEGNIKIGEAFISNSNIEIYSDKAIPASNESKIGSYPHQSLMKANTPIDIKRMTIKNTDITYSEYNTKTKRQGHIYFFNTFGEISNINNNLSLVRENPFMVVKAQSKFMKAGNLKATFKFDILNYKRGLFNITADVEGFNATQLNEATVGLASVRVRKAQLKRYHLRVWGDNFGAKGKSSIAFEGLEIETLKLDNEESKLKKQGLMSFIANNFKINKDYPKKDSPKEINTSYVRPPEKSFFSVLWKTIFNGLKEPIGL